MPSAVSALTVNLFTPRSVVRKRNRLRPQRTVRACESAPNEPSHKRIPCETAKITWPGPHDRVPRFVHRGCAIGLIPGQPVKRSTGRSANDQLSGYHAHHGWTGRRARCRLAPLRTVALRTRLCTATAPGALAGAHRAGGPANPGLDPRDGRKVPPVARRLELRSTRCCTSTVGSRAEHCRLRPEAYRDGLLGREPRRPQKSGNGHGRRAPRRRAGRVRRRCRAGS